MWLRVDDPDKQPALQLAVEGRLNGEIYYRPARLGAGDSRSPSPPRLTSQWAPYLVRIDNLPAAGLSDLRVAIDLMGAGDLWVDDVQIFDLWFDKTERNELVKTIALANFYLGKGDVVECQRILDGYWPKFLRRHVPIPEPRMASALESAPGGSQGAPMGDRDDGEPAAESTPWFKRIMPKPPKLPVWFR
jgi:hypothetical protein